LVATHIIKSTFERSEPDYANTKLLDFFHVVCYIMLAEALHIASSLQRLIISIKSLCGCGKLRFIGAAAKTNRKG
jgi:hypothetical protein